ncbi:hypothetical protein M3Y99_01184000 [Aphelenchoides fujianensis]|nr:hypothetical protein M3Y99_01184000 [Aphelenchoides fujianensis]
MLALLLFLLFLLGHPPTSHESPTAYPCINGRLMFVVDVSTDLTKESYQKQTDFLSYNVFTDEWTDLSRLTLVQYDQTAWDIPFDDEEVAGDVRLELRNADQLTYANLTRVFETIYRWKPQRSEETVHLLVFVSRIDQAAVDTSRPFVQSLQQKNYELTFVAVGGQLDAALFYQLSANLIQWDVERQNRSVDFVRQTFYNETYEQMQGFY